MKAIRYLLIIFIFCRAVSLNCQTTIHTVNMDYQEIAEYNVNPCKLESNDTTLYSIVDSMPEFPGGVDSLYIFIKENLKIQKKNILMTEL